MPTIGWFEILIVEDDAIIVSGPKDFPIMLKKAGSWIGTAKKYINNVQSEISNIDIEDNPKKKEVDKKEDIYSNIDEMLSSTLDSEDNK